MSLKTPKRGPIGKYVFCPRSSNGALHGLVAKQVSWGGRAYHFKCVCGFRGMWPPGVAGPPLFTLEQVLAAGALVPDEVPIPTDYVRQVPRQSPLASVELGPTGRYAHCPRSDNGAFHGRVAMHVKRGPKVFYAQCVCGFEGFWPKGEAGVPILTKQDAIRAGAMIPDEV